MEGQESGPRLHAEVEGDFRPNPRRRMECLFKMMTFTLGRILGKIHLLLCYHFPSVKWGQNQNWPFLKLRKTTVSNFTFSPQNMKGGRGLRGDVEDTGWSGPGPADLCRGKSCWQALDRQGSPQALTPLQDLASKSLGPSRSSGDPHL